MMQESENIGNEDDGFNGEHFEGLGAAWSAIFGNSDDLTNYLGDIVSSANVIAQSKAIFEGVERDVMLTKNPVDGSITAGSLTALISEEKQLLFISAYPIFEGIPNRLTITATHTWENGIEGEVAAGVDSGASIQFFDPFYFKDRISFVEETKHTVSLAALALKISKAEHKEITINSGPFFEDRLKNFLMENPSKTEADFDAPVVVMDGSRILFPTNYISEFGFQCPVLSVEEISFFNIRFYKMYVEFVGMDEDIINGYLYASERILNGYIPEAGHDVQGVLWMTGYLLENEIQGSHDEGCEPDDETGCIIAWAELERELNEDIPSTEVVSLLQRRYISQDSVKALIARYNNFLKLLPQIPDFFYSNRDISDLPKIDTSQLLAVYPKIKMSNDFVLDYIYAHNWKSGEPFLYSRRTNEKPLSSYEDYCTKFAVTQEPLLGCEPTIQQTFPFLRGIEIQNEPEAFFELSLFTMNGRRFHLFDHSNYNNRRYIMTPEGVKRFVNDGVGGFAPEEFRILDYVDPTPLVIQVGDFSIVVLLNYEMNVGYSFLQVYFKKNLFVKTETVLLLKAKGQTFY